MMSRPIQAKTQFLQVLRHPTPLRFQNHLIPQLSLTLRLPHISIPDPCDLTPQSLISPPSNSPKKPSVPRPVEPRVPRLDDAHIITSAVPSAVISLGQHLL
ncbi:hypothetical protein C8034_v001617 [Colletotrichum sidae]|uniref:Uncharacterized protein n=1 Tax=Colletotrichum sidae TaxID=1347389 RepID=A0A4R8TFZ6_9PEZI|nr:hypothetical protein C8034_v001617 [Colletotrichum sidae]